MVPSPRPTDGPPPGRAMYLGRRPSPRRCAARWRPRWMVGTDEAAGWSGSWSLLAGLALVVDLPADLVLLPVDLALLGLGDVTSVGGRVGALLGPDRAILAVELPGLAVGQLVICNAVVDPAVLVC